MPIQASPYNAVPNGISRPATPPSPQEAQMLMQLMQGGGAQGPGGPGDAMTPPGAQLPPPPGTPPGMTPDPNIGMSMQDPEKPDLFQRVAYLIMEPGTKQVNPMMAMLFAGIGLARVLEKSGKQENLSHKSNEEQAAAGINTGIPGQTGLKDPSQMAKSLGSMPGF